MMQFFQSLRDDCHDFLQQHKSANIARPVPVEPIAEKTKSVKIKQPEGVPVIPNKKQESKIKKPASPFLLYYSENYHRIAKKYPGNPFKEMMKYVS